LRVRVIAGSHKGRRLSGPPGSDTRPTASRVKEALFSILTNQITGARFLDLYAGTGAIGIEALSRGAAHATFVESSATSLRVLRSNLTRCGLAATADVQACSAEMFLRRPWSSRTSYTIVFADPPYRRTEEGIALLRSLDAGGMIAPSARVILEHITKHPSPPRIGRLVKLRDYRYGDTTLSVFGMDKEETTLA
jgi:16S rRNA (guanine(966)-N(2))-methyltransferase RsmD